MSDNNKILTFEKLKSDKWLKRLQLYSLWLKPFYKTLEVNKNDAIKIKQTETLTFIQIKDNGDDKWKAAACFMSWWRSAGWNETYSTDRVTLLLLKQGTGKLSKAPVTLGLREWRLDTHQGQRQLIGTTFSLCCRSFA